MKELRVEGLTKTYGTKTVVDGVSFTVAEGEFCILLGPSGCGKTTILRMIAGLIRQDAGRMYIGNREVSDCEPRDRDIAMVFQSYALYPHLTAHENMAFPLRVRGMARNKIDEQVRQAAHLLNVEELLDRKPAELSGGQRQRVAIGRALVRKPSLFLFDEPLSNLDAQLRSSMRAELARLHRNIRGTIVYVTHDQTEAMTLGQKIIVFNKGRIQQTGSPQEIYSRPTNVFVASFIGSPPINLLEASLSADCSSVTCAAATLPVPASRLQGLSRLAGQKLIIGIRPESLRPGDGPIQGTIEHIENLGADHILHLLAGDSLLLVKTAARAAAPQRGDSLSLQLKPEEVLFFHESRLIA